MATVPPHSRQQRHSSPDVSQFATASTHQNPHPHNHFRHAPPPVTIPTAVSKPHVPVPTIDTTANSQTQDQHNSSTLRLPLTPVKDHPESPLTPTSASELKVPSPFASNSSNYNTGAPVRPTAALLSQSSSFEFSPSSVTSSPGMEHIPRMTPLPSPIVRGGSPGPWYRIRSRSVSRPTSRSSLSVFNSGESVFVTTAGETLSQAVGAQSQRKVYQNLANSVPKNSTVHTPGELSLEVPGVNSRSRHAAHKTDTEPTGLGISDAMVAMKREECLAKSVRHRATSIESITESSPTVAGGRSSLSSSSSVSSTDTAPTVVSDDKEVRIVKRTRLAEFEAYTVPGNDIKKWKAIRLLGQGTFSKVMLATSEENPEYHIDQASLDEDGLEDDKDRGLDPRFLVAVKIVENSAAGGASRDRVESSLKRELDILKTVDHPSLVQLKAFSIQPTRALLVLPYCPGGDLFDLASEHRELLTPPLIRRLFAELLGAVRYLHTNGIVHRDVKLENVLLNITPTQLASLSNPPFDHPNPLITLTDLGLSKRVDFANDPMLTTRCGSEDYASPELLMGQSYDGRQTDAWALGVLLYALLEGRLPFDPLPGAGNKMRSRTAHRIARCEWKWFNLNGEEAAYDVELQGGKEIVNGLLKRVSKRMGLEQVEEDIWVKDAIEVDLKRIDDFGS